MIWYYIGMTARDRWTDDLKCPKCGKRGVAELSQNDGWSYSNGDQSTRVDHLPEGFRADRRSKSNRIDFICMGCDEKAIVS